MIVCGDHGMSDQGGHGGATESEIKVPVIFLRTGEISSQKKKKGIDREPAMYLLSFFNNQWNCI